MPTQHTKILSKLFQLIQKFYCLHRREQNDRTLNMFQVGLIKFIAVNENIGMYDLALEFGMRPSSMTENINVLEELGWIVKSKDANDKRKVLVGLSAKAFNEINSLVRRQAKKYAWILSRVDSDKTAIFFEVLTDIEKTIDLNLKKS
jgi:DNA-binding MarR family transcriptional regulator